MLIKSVLGREVPSGKLPANVGALVQNVGSIATLAEVFETGLPLVERIVTVSGHGVRQPSNLIVPVGTKLRDLLAFCGGTTDDAAEVLNGGPMMGLAQRDLDAPVLKGTTGIVVLTADEVRGQESFPCIHCGRCLDACPMFLNPSLLGDLARAGRYEAMDDEQRARPEEVRGRRDQRHEAADDVPHDRPHVVAPLEVRRRGEHERTRRLRRARVRRGGSHAPAALRFRSAVLLALNSCASGMLDGQT
jgi:ferredoxin